MFAGIIQERGTIKKIKKSSQGVEVFIFAPKIFSRVKIGSSVAVNGVCLTVAEKSARVLKFILMPETVGRTTFVTAHVGEAVGLETSLRASDEIGGHFVYGHIDSRGKIVKLQSLSGATIMIVGVLYALTRYMVIKGSIAVDGVSLTIMKLKRDSFEVSLLKQTLNLTSLGVKKVGDEVNIEVDMINKFLVERF